MQVGDKLKNGGIVLAVKANLLLAIIPEPGRAHPFATWTFNAEGDTFWGDYFTNIEEAVEGYIARVKEG